jgi:outer membrane receptor protein involved in Fe transport
VWKRELGDGATLQARITGTIGRRHSDASYQGFDGVGMLQQAQEVQAEADDRSLLASGKYLSTNVEGHALAIGWDAEARNRRERRIQIEVPLPGHTPVDLDELNASTTRRLAIFAQDEWDIDKSASVYFGLRWEGLQTETSPSVGLNVSRWFSVFSPVVQGVWRPAGAGGGQFRLALSRTYRAPTPVELIPRRYVAVNNSPANPDTQGNPVLAPELANSVDIAWELNIGRVGFVGVNLIWRRIDDIVVERLSQENGVWIASRANQGRADVKGLGFEGRVKLHEIFPQIRQMELRGNVAINNSSVQAIPGPNNRLDRQSPWTASVGGNWRANKFPLTLGIDLSAKGGGIVRLSNERWLERRSDRTMDLFATLQVSSSNLLRLTVSNAAPVDMREVKKFSSTSGSFSQAVTTKNSPTIKIAWEVKL